MSEIIAESRPERIIESRYISLLPGAGRCTQCTPRRFRGFLPAETNRIFPAVPVQFSADKSGHPDQQSRRNRP
jgi:hypothetical protein